MMSKRKSILSLAIASAFIAQATSAAQAEQLQVTLRRRDPQSGEIQTSAKSIDPKRTAIVVVDVWNYHWCTTWVGRAGTMIPRMNKVFDAAREMGFTIVFAPTDCSSGHAGTPARERMAGLPEHPLPEPIAFDPPAPWGFNLGAGCMCGGPYPCVVNYDNYSQDARLIIKDGDYVSSGHKELYNLCKEKGITTLIHAGGATNMCLCQKPEGMIGMTRLGFDCILARDITQAHSVINDSEHADKNTEASVAHIEKHIGPSIHFVNELRKANQWSDDWVVDSVMIAPWGFPDRPKFFNDTLTLSMSMPHMDDAEIRYTLDGSEPTTRSSIYEGPLKINETATLRAAAFRGQLKVSLESQAKYAKLIPAPPRPDIFLSDLDPYKISMSGWSEWYDQGPDFPPPRNDLSYKGGPLVLRGVTYKRGLGLRAPAQVIYRVPRGAEAFVACAGVDESFLGADTGRGKAQYPSVVFRVFIDGKLAAESPMMRTAQEPWRFHVPIPDGARLISLATTDGGNGHQEDYVNWVDAGFVATGSGPGAALGQSSDGDWIQLFNGKNLDGWYTLLNGQGRDKDPSNVFQVHDGAIHLYKDHEDGADAPVGYFGTVASYAHYHLRFEYKWGTKRFKPRNKTKRDSGLLYHTFGDDQVWPRSVELQIQEGDTGDIFTVGATGGIVALKPNVNPRTYLAVEEGGIPLFVGHPQGQQRVVRSPMNEKDGWNVCEAIVRGDREALHIVNGKVNNRLANLKYYDNKKNQWAPLTEGRIVFQAEYAEVLYRNIEIKLLPD